MVPRSETAITAMALLRPSEVRVVPRRTCWTAGSPFVIIFERIGIAGAATLLNVVVLTAAVSAYNSGLYSNGRMLYNLSRQGDAPRYLSKLNKSGSPYAGVLTSSAVTAVAVVLEVESWRAESRDRQQHADQAGADLSGQPDALRFAPGQGPRVPAQA